MAQEAADLQFLNKVCQLEALIQVQAQTIENVQLSLLDLQ
jgi:hypothetical protein